MLCAGVQALPEAHSSYAPCGVAAKVLGFCKGENFISESPTVDALQAALPPRLYTVGRLDVATTGLIFLTNDGVWANKVIHPSASLTKVIGAALPPGQTLPRRFLTLITVFLTCLFM